MLIALAYFYSEGTHDTEPTPVIVAVRGYLSAEQVEAMEKQMNLYAPKGLEYGVKLKVIELPAEGSPIDPKEAARTLDVLRMELSEGAADLFLLDNYAYDLLADDTLFEDLSQIYHGDPALISRYRCAIKYKKFSSAPDLSELPIMTISLRNKKSAIVNKNARTLGSHGEQSELLKNIMNNTPQQ